MGLTVVWKVPRRTSASVSAYSLSHVGSSAPGGWNLCHTQSWRAVLSSGTLLSPKMSVDSPAPGDTFPRTFQSDLDDSPTFYLERFYFQIQDPGIFWPVMLMTSAKSIFEHFFNKLSRKSGHLFLSNPISRYLIILFSSISPWSRSQFHFSAYVSLKNQ